MIRNRARFLLDAGSVDKRSIGGKDDEGEKATNREEASTA
jgi:hypothetical protein